MNRKVGPNWMDWFNIQTSIEYTNYLNASMLRAIAVFDVMMMIAFLVSGIKNLLLHVNDDAFSLMHCKTTGKDSRKSIYLISSTL